ncbi:hypothetical protein [uncultured Erythrobacter sp.]|uniref:hypothetical protein n=1 Tax=uncultured Erythrobacter sp. TaxID=263913 RepID=UPI002622953B|nr:hypothetical protein [uncultured Erythrobacter sp.]
MTIFARRRIQTMLDQLAPTLDPQKGRDLLRRLNDTKYVAQALPAEMELALVWATGRLGGLEIEPEWWGDQKRPDIVTDRLVPGREAAIEIAATNDNAISGEEEMDAIARQMSAAANEAEKGSGNFLYFSFAEESGFERGQYFRKRMAPKNYELREHIKQALAQWVSSGRSLTQRIRLSDAGLDVTVERKSYRQTRYHNIHSSMPPETHSLEGNPLFGLLRRKKRQLKAAHADTLRVIFVADVGSTLLRRIGEGRETYGSQLTFSGSQIISHFVAKYSEEVDAIVVFSPCKDSSGFGETDIIGRKRRRWNVSFFGTSKLPDPPPALEEIASSLPAPHYEGYQARSLFRQGSFQPNSRGQYLGMTIKSTTGKDDLRIEFPARMLLDLLAGRMTEKQFRLLLEPNNSRNIFEHWLSRGLTISGAEMAPRDLDEDDDHLILYFSDDPSARPFVLP